MATGDDGGKAPDQVDQADTAERSENVPSIDVHQPGDSDENTLAPHEVDGVPPDAVGGQDDQGGGPADRAPDAPEDA